MLWVCHLDFIAWSINEKLILVHAKTRSLVENLRVLFTRQRRHWIAADGEFDEREAERPHIRLHCVRRTSKSFWLQVSSMTIKTLNN